MALNDCQIDKKSWVFEEETEVFLFSKVEEKKKQRMIKTMINKTMRIPALFVLFVFEIFMTVTLLLLTFIPFCYFSHFDEDTKHVLLAFRIEIGIECIPPTKNALIFAMPMLNFCVQYVQSSCSHSLSLSLPLCTCCAAFKPMLDKSIQSSLLTSLFD